MDSQAEWADIASMVSIVQIRTALSKVAGQLVKNNQGCFDPETAI
jgi:hypothetical protein